jgi:ribonuclease D
MAAPLYCTRTASRLVRTYTDRHGLKDLVKELLGHDLSKQQQTSDWGRRRASDAQREYAASDVAISMRSRRSSTSGWPAKSAPSWPRPAFDFLPARALLDLAGWPSRTFSRMTADV